MFAEINCSPVLPNVSNERVLDYAPGSPERGALEAELRHQSAEQIELPLFIGSAQIATGKMQAAIAPHDHRRVLGNAHLGGAEHAQKAIEAAKNAAPDWSRTPWAQRAAIFLKAADLLANAWRPRLNAATMLGQSKTAHQAEIDSAAELIDFLRFNASYMARIYGEQPISSAGIWNQTDYRPLEGFVYAATPFNFTAIAGNLPSAPALMGNTVVWKPSATAKLSAHYVMEILREAGLPDGVINLIHGDAAEITDVMLASEDFGGLHFTGSTSVFNAMTARIAARRYRNYPRVVGETGGKNFIVAHASADVEALCCAIIRGAFEYQGQKCSAASRIFVPSKLWSALKPRLLAEIAQISVGDVANFSNFMGAVIDERAWRKHMDVFTRAHNENSARVICGGDGANETGYFIAPTLIETDDAASFLMKEEFFGPIASVYAYREARFSDVLTLIDATSEYGLTGAVFATDRGAIAQAKDALRYAAGNFYINDKPTGAVVGQQPFGGARTSGTNDKAGSMWNLMRWTSPRTIKETFSPPHNWRYPFMA